MRLASLLLVLAMGVAPAGAQRDTRLEIALPTGSSVADPPAIRALSVLGDKNLRELLHSGFPARLHYRVELWRSRGFFDDLASQTEWDVIVRYNPLEKRYSAARFQGERATSLGDYADLASVETAIDEAYQPPIHAPDTHDKVYYNAVLDVEMLSVSDLDEVERWLKGELRPSLHGEKNPGSALGEGAKQLITRLLGGEQRHYEVRSRQFRPR